MSWWEILLNSAGTLWIVVTTFRLVPLVRWAPWKTDDKVFSYLYLVGSAFILTYVIWTTP